ncbi:hypothetical protein DTW89_01085 [Acidovorax sp. BoFeN1]|nr:hypothetical protein DTW89_01085 [Acidovorax sp. BoFeN1]
MEAHSMTKETLKTLIDKAAEICGSQRALAEQLGVKPHHVSEWKSGGRKCMPDDQAAMAGIAGFNAIETLARATVEAAEGTKKHEVLLRTLGKYLAATGAAIGSSGAAASVADLIRCILC